MTSGRFLPCRVVVIQPSVPSYRLPFFTRLSSHFGPQLFSVYASRGDLGVLSARSVMPDLERPLGAITTILRSVDWQSGALSIDIGPNDVIIISGAPRCLSNVALLLKCRLRGAKVVWWSHYWSATSKRLNFMIRVQLMKLADAVLFYTDSELDRFKRECSSSKPAFALNNGIDVKSVAEHRRPYVPNERSRDLLFIGRLTKKSNLGLLLKTLALPDCRHLTLDIIGGGEEDFALKSLAEASGLVDRIRWHGGFSDEVRISEVANHCKLFVYPGSVGLSLIHAMAYGLPAVVHDNRLKHMPEIDALKPGENGVTFRFEDSLSLSKSILQALEYEPDLRRMSECAIETTQNSFNTDDMAERFIRMIDELAPVALVSR